jgi:hypothetical protein
MLSNLGFIRLSCPFRLRKNNLRVRHENKKEWFKMLVF